MNQAASFVKDFQKQLAGPCGLARGTRILLAVSGGADSTAMLRCFAGIRRRSRWRLDVHVGHVNHQLRPEAADEAEQVAALCRHLDLPFHTRKISPADEPGNRESAARRLRYEQLGSMAGEIIADALATAHQADDQLETLLMRLTRGSGLNGLSGIHSRRKLAMLPCPVIRPMLFTDRARIEHYLNAIDQPWIEDASNENRQLWRNRLRHEVLPVLRSLRRDAAVKTVAALEQIQETARLVKHQIRQAESDLLRETENGRTISRTGLKNLPPLIRRGLLKRVLIRSGASADRISRSLLADIDRAVLSPDRSRRSFLLNGGVEICIAGEELELLQAAPQTRSAKTR